MEKMRTKELFNAMAAALTLASAGAAHAGSLTQNITLSGTIEPAAVTCSFYDVNPTININAQAVASRITSSAIWINFGCTKESVPFSLRSPLQWVPITIGGEPAGAYLKTNIGLNLFSAPYYYTTLGDGSAPQQRFQVVIGGAAYNSNLDPTKHVGTISGVLPMELQY